VTRLLSPAHSVERESLGVTAGRSSCSKYSHEAGE
jgi:hypothetical protein